MDTLITLFRAKRSVSEAHFLKRSFYRFIKFFSGFNTTLERLAVYFPFDIIKSNPYTV